VRNISLFVSNVYPGLNNRCSALFSQHWLIYILQGQPGVVGGGGESWAARGGEGGTWISHPGLTRARRIWFPLYMISI